MPSRLSSVHSTNWVISSFYNLNLKYSRGKWDSNPRTFNSCFFSKEILSATQTLPQKSIPRRTWTFKFMFLRHTCLPFHYRDKNKNKYINFLFPMRIELILIPWKGTILPFRWRKRQKKKFIKNSFYLLFLQFKKKIKNQIKLKKPSLIQIKQ